MREEWLPAFADALLNYLNANRASVLAMAAKYGLCEPEETVDTPVVALGALAQPSSNNKVVTRRR